MWTAVWVGPGSRGQKVGTPLPPPPAPALPGQPQPCVLSPVTEDLLSLLAELQEAVQAGAVGSSLGLVSDCCPTLVCFWQSRCSVSPTVTVLPPQAAAPDAGADSYVVLHVVSCEEEFQQQKLDLLWWKLDHQAPLSQVG